MQKNNRITKNFNYNLNENLTENIKIKTISTKNNCA